MSLNAKQSPKIKQILNMFVFALNISSKSVVDASKCNDVFKVTILVASAAN